MENQKFSQEYYCLLVQDNSNNNYYICFKCSQKHLTNEPKTRLVNEVRTQNSEVRSCFCNEDLCPYPKTFRLKMRGFRPIFFDKLLITGTAIIITLLTSLTPMNQETLDTQTQTIQIIENYATITRLIWEFYRK